MMNLNIAIAHKEIQLLTEFFPGVIIINNIHNPFLNLCTLFTIISYYTNAKVCMYTNEQEGISTISNE